MVLIFEKHYSYCILLSIPEMMLYEPELHNQTLLPEDHYLACSSSEVSHSGVEIYLLMCIWPLHPSSTSLQTVTLHDLFTTVTTYRREMIGSWWLLDHGCWIYSLLSLASVLPSLVCVVYLWALDALEPIQQT